MKKELAINLMLVLLSWGMVCNVNGATLTAGTPITSVSATAGNTVGFNISVPSGATDLIVAINGGTGDADLYVRAGAQPTVSNYDCRPYLWGNDENCFIANPQATTYYINVVAYESFSGVTVLATYTAGTGGGSNTQQLENGELRNDLSGGSGSEVVYEISLPANSTNLTVTTSGGTGDADLYVRYNAAPTTSAYDCRPYLNGNNETCQTTSPQAGTHYIMLRGYTAYSGVSLSVSYTINGSYAGATWEGFESYYSDAIGLSGPALLSALHEDAARSHNRMTYSQVWDALKYTDEDPNNSNNVILIYTGRSQAKSFNASTSNDPDAWNREHTWPKSHGFPNSGDWAYTDIHHLRPADVSVNSTRGNKDYDNGGSLIGEAPGNYSDSDSFEPRDEIKGDIARMMFYMDVRYNGGDNTGTDDLTLVNYTGTSGADLGSLCALLAWHNQDPVSSEEIARHARIVERQGNRNPFVDYPAWANELWSPYCN